MDKQLQALQRNFEDAVQRTDAEGVEFWFARDLQAPLGYTRWENFQTAIHRAVESCEASNHAASDHFRGVTKMVVLGSTASREIDDFMLTRYACYLIAQNGDSRKPEIAFAQSYFAIQTRKQELIEDRMRLQAWLEARERLKESEKALSQNIYERGVDEAGFGRIRSRGVNQRAKLSRLGVETASNSFHLGMQPSGIFAGGIWSDLHGHHCRNTPAPCGAKAKHFCHRQGNGTLSTDGAQTSHDGGGAKL